MEKFETLANFKPSMYFSDRNTLEMWSRVVFINQSFRIVMLKKVISYISKSVSDRIRIYFELIINAAELDLIDELKQSDVEIDNGRIEFHPGFAKVIIFDDYETISAKCEDGSAITPFIDVIYDNLMIDVDAIDDEIQLLYPGY